MAGALGLLVPGVRSDSIGLAVLLFVHFFQTARSKTEALMTKTA